MNFCTFSGQYLHIPAQTVQPFRFKKGHIVYIFKNPFHIFIVHFSIYVSSFWQYFYFISSYYVYCFAPKYQGKFLYCKNLHKAKLASDWLAPNSCKQLNKKKEKGNYLSNDRYVTLKIWFLIFSQVFCYQFLNWIRIPHSSIFYIDFKKDRKRKSNDPRSVCPESNTVNTRAAAFILKPLSGSARPSA